jgi:hypothetical protein
METNDKLPGFNYVPFTREDLAKSMLELKESGKCPVHDPKFYEPWDMVEVGTEEYYSQLRASKELIQQRREKLKMMNKKTK